MHNFIKEYRSFILNEDVNSALIDAKKKVNDQLQAIRNEIQNEKAQTETPAKIASLKKQASLYAALPAMLNALATSMENKEKSGDQTKIY
jgi:hypothetical protein